MPYTGSMTFGDETCTYSNGVLPVVFQSLNVHKNEGAVIEWITLSEVNNEYFAIERSTDGIIFHEIGIVARSGKINFQK